MDVVEESQNPPVDTIETTDNDAIPIKDDVGKIAEEKKVEVKEEPTSEARDTVEDVKEFLEKDKQIFDDSVLSQGPINLDSLSPIQKLKLASLAQAKAREEILKFHIEDSELVNLVSGILEKIMSVLMFEIIKSKLIRLKG